MPPRCVLSSGPASSVQYLLVMRASSPLPPTASGSVLAVRASPQSNYRKRCELQCTNVCFHLSRWCVPSARVVVAANGLERCVVIT
eukprot:6187451-Amphidinium_carterae.1